MGRRDADFFTDIGGLEAQVLAHQEHLSGARGKHGEAALERLQELLVL